MSPDLTLKLIISLSLLTFLLKPLTGLLMDVFKLMLRMALVGLVLHLIPLDYIDEWSREGAGWAHVTAQYVPVIALMGLIALSTANLLFLSDTTAEQVIRLVFYTVGGVFTVGSAEWLAWETNIGEVVSGLVHLATSSIAIFSVVLT